ncbi:MAG: hypothetical protein LQ348_002444 [Seirophora lacunosa]|nr:MAG: hypothetical protein LQ348_002444 [Seirophora lacunosa]
MRRNDPRIRQTLNQISQTVDTAQYTTRASLFSFHQTYLSPCLAHLSTCLEASCAPCYTCVTNAASSAHPSDAAARRRRGGRRRGREELSFDFYDDWAAEEEEGWGNDELDRLLAGNETTTAGDGQPGRRKGMSYNYGGIASRRKGGEEDTDANMVPRSSMFGFLERLPWKIGGRGRRYKPSAADLQDVGEGSRGKLKAHGEDERLISEGESGGGEAGKSRHGRKRSGTVGSRETTTSLSSRGDLFPSDDEAADAVPLGDEFAMVLARRTTQGTMSDDNSRGKSRAASARTKSSRSPASVRKNPRGSSDERVDGAQVPSMTDLKQEEARASAEEEESVGRDREAARKLAAERGLLDLDGLRDGVS